MKRLTAMLLSGVMAASLMAVPTQAEEATGTVTIKLAHNMDFITIPDAIVAAADYLNEKYDLNLPENEEYETLAGLILYYNEDIPEEGERISIEDISFEIVSVKSARIEEVRVKI